MKIALLLAMLIAGNAAAAEDDLPLLHGDWFRMEQTSNFDDSRNVYLSTGSLSPLTCSLLGEPKEATLMIRCMENTTAIYVATNCHLASGFGDYGSVDFRVDEQPAFTRSLDASTDNSSLGLWSGRKSIPVIRDRILGGDTLIMRLTPFNKSPVEMEFSLDGLSDQISYVRKECGW